MKKRVQMIINILIIVLMPFMMYMKIGNSKVNVALSDIMLLLIGILFLFNIKVFFLQKQWFYILYFAGLVFSLLLSQFISGSSDTFLHVEINVMLMEVIKTLVVAMYFFSAFIFIKSEKDYKLSLVAVSLSSIPVMIVGGTSSAYFLMGKDFFINTYKLDTLRFMGTFEDPNLCALYFLIVFFVSILNFKIIKNLLLRSLMLGLSIFSFIILILTMSRGGWLAFAGAIVVFIILNFRNFKKENLLVLTSVAILALFFINLDYDFQHGKITNDMVNRVEESLSNDTNNIDRVQLMKAAFKMGNDNFFFGVGKGSFPLNSYKYLPEKSTDYEKSLIPHNTILGFYAQQGIVGVLLFIILPVFILYAIIKSGRNQNLFLISICIGVFIHSITINIENVRFIWYILGLMMAGEKVNINLDFVTSTKINKRIFTIVLTTLLLLLIFSYMNVSRKLAINIYESNGAIYNRKIFISEPGDYELSFDIQTDNHLHSVEIYDGNELIKKMDFKSAYGVVHIPIHLGEECKVVFKSNEGGWMRVNNAHVTKGQKKIPLYNYVLLPRFAEEWLNQKDLLVYSEIPSFKKQIVVEGNKFNDFEILDAKVTRYSNFSHIYQFNIESKQKIATNYQMELLLDYQSISSLLPNEYQKNLRIHRFTIYPYTVEWIVGRKYTTGTAGLFSSDDFDLYGRFYEYANDKYSQESYFPIDYDFLKEKQEIVELGQSQWINIIFRKDKEGIIYMTNNGWVESGRMNLKPGDYNITFKAKGSFLEGFSKIRLRDSTLQQITEITLDDTMKEYTVKYHVDEYQPGVSFILELINYKSEESFGSRQVLLKDWIKVD